MNDLTKVEKQIENILKENKMQFDYEFDFSRYRELPPEVILALKILNNHGMKVIISLALK